MKQVIGYAVLLIAAFILAGVCGLVLVKTLRPVVTAVSSKLNAKQGS